MAIEWRCPNCDHLLHAQYDAAGERTACVGCGQIVDVPWGKSVAVYISERIGNLLGTAPVWLGIAGLLFSWVPVLGAMLSIPVALLGIILGGVAIVGSPLRGGRGLRQPLIGIALCVAAIGVSLTSTLFTVGQLRDRAQRVKAAQSTPVDRVAPTTGVRGPPVMTIDGHRADEPVRPDATNVPLKVDGHAR